MNAHKPQLLIISFSDLFKDARLLKQITMFAPDYEVTTCGYGPAPVDDVRHIKISRAKGRVWRFTEALLLRARWYRAAYWVNPVVRDARAALRGASFDAVIANDLDTVGVTLSLFDASRAHADLHEYWLGVHDNVPAWVKLRAPFHGWMLQHWVTRVASVTTVNRAIADRYEREFGFSCAVVTNASQYQELQPSELSDPLRLVHSGGAQPNRKIELMMTAVAKSDLPATLDLLLVGEGTEYYRELCALADSLGDRVNVLPSVPHEELIETLNDYDLGLTFLPPTTTNIALVLPNKLFDYVQARIGVISGPNPVVVDLVESHPVGAITEDFDEASLVRLLNSITREQVLEWKHQADAVAFELSAERQSEPWRSAVQALTTTQEHAA